jgi:hypothetical protein
MENMQAELQISHNLSISPYVDLRNWKEIASYKGYGQLGEI